MTDGPVIVPLALSLSFCLLQSLPSLQALSLFFGGAFDLFWWPLFFCRPCRSRPGKASFRLSSRSTANTTRKERLELTARQRRDRQASFCLSFSRPCSCRPRSCRCISSLSVSSLSVLSSLLYWNPVRIAVQPLLKRNIYCGVSFLPIFHSFY